MVFARNVFKQIVWHSNFIESCFSSYRPLSLLIRSGIHTVSARDGKEIINISVNFTYIYIDDGLSINNVEFDYYLGKIYQIKDTTESNTFLSRLITVDREGPSNSHFHL